MQQELLNIRDKGAGLQVYTIYSILFIVFLILLIVTAFITIALTYFQLAVEDHRWWWRSFMCGGSTGQSFVHELKSRKSGASKVLCCINGSGAPHVSRS